MTIGSVLYLMLIGLLAGAIARFLVPGRDPLGLIGTMLLGIVGSFLGGVLGSLISGEEFGNITLEPAGFLGSILGAIVALIIWRQIGPRKRR